jgi:hypothetical protein
MNIFILDKEIEKCARYHADQHVVKMILESAQMLCTVVNQSGGTSPYRTTHANHPCTLWTGKSLSNWLWLRELALALNDEYRYRFNSEMDHRSAVVASSLSVPPLSDSGLTEFAQAMPEEYRIPGDPVAAYRRYYVAEKSEFVRWTGRRRPDWFVQGLKTLHCHDV